MIAKKLIVLIALFTFCASSHLAAQASDATCNCAQDLQSLHSRVQLTPSYKENKSVYLKHYKAACEQVSSIHTDYDCYLLLAELLLSLNDNHGRLYGTDKGATEEIRKDEALLEEFKQSDLYRAYPMSSLSLDSLAVALSSMSKTDIEGIYHMPGKISLGLYHDRSSDNYKAVVLHTDTEMWRAGEIMYTFKPYSRVLDPSLTVSDDSYLLGVGGSLSSKRMISYTERIIDGVFLTTGFRKDTSHQHYAGSIHSDTTYLRKELSPDVTYLKIGSFSSWYPTLGEADDFYKSLEETITAPHLIIDLRDNSGGGNRNSSGLLQIIKKHVKSGKVYLITNHSTISNAEQFTLSVSALKNSTILGQATNGTLTYEVKDQIGGTLACGKFLVQLASKKHSKYLAYESRGISPDVTLDLDSDWLEQVMEYVSQQK